MAILHYRVKRADDSIVLNNSIDSQSFIFRRAIVKLYRVAGQGANPPTAIPANTDLNNGGVVVKPSHFSGFEIVSDQNQGLNDIMLAFEGDKPIHNIYYDMEFDSEAIQRGFTVKVHQLTEGTNGVKVDAVFAPRDTNGNLITTGAGQAVAGQIEFIDLFFQFESLYNYKSY